MAAYANLPNGSMARVRRGKCMKEGTHDSRALQGVTVTAIVAVAKSWVIWSCV